MTDDYIARKTRMFVRIVPELGAIPPDPPNSSPRWLHGVSACPLRRNPATHEGHPACDDAQHEAPGSHWGPRR